MILFPYMQKKRLRMTLVISNQLDNAIKFIKIDEGAIDVVPEKKEENQEVVVSKNDKILQVIFT
jgi:signal transduction histidine kinase